MSVEEIALHPTQAEFRSSKALIRGFVGAVGRARVLSAAGSFPQGGRSLNLVVGPTYPQLRDSCWRTLSGDRPEVGGV